MFKENFKRLRTQRGLSQTKIADIMNITPQAVSSWETGRTQPNMEQIYELVEILNTSVQELCAEIDELTVKVNENEKMMLDAYRKSSQEKRLMAYFLLMGGKLNESSNIHES